MKKYVQMLVAVVTAMFLASCGNSPSSNNTIYGGGGGGGGGGRRVVTPASPTRVSDSVFGNQPMRPTSDVVRESWRGTMNTSHWANDSRRGYAMIQACSPDEPVLISRATGFVWRYGCENRVAPAEAPTQEVVENVGSVAGGGNYQDNRSQTSYMFEWNMPITIINSGEGGGGGGWGGGGGVRSRQHRPQPQYCIVRDPCGRPIGKRLIGYR